MLKSFLGKLVILYLDDILVFSKIRQEHIEHLVKVMKNLHIETLLVNIKKCSFMYKELIYLGFIIFQESL